MSVQLKKTVSWILLLGMLLFAVPIQPAFAADVADYITINSVAVSNGVLTVNFDTGASHDEGASVIVCLVHKEDADTLSGSTPADTWTVNDLMSEADWTGMVEAGTLMYDYFAYGTATYGQVATNQTITASVKSTSLSSATGDFTVFVFSGWDQGPTVPASQTIALVNGSTPKPLEYTGGTLNFTVGTAATNQTVATAKYGNSTTYSYALKTGTLPAGLTLAADGSGKITGTPTAVNEAGATVTITVTNAGDTKDADWTIKVAKGKKATPTITVSDITTTGFKVNVPADAHYVITTSATAPTDEAAYDQAGTGAAVEITGKTAGTQYYVHAIRKGDANYNKSDAKTQAVKTAEPVQATIEAFAQTKAPYGTALPAVVVKAGGKTLVKDTDYTVAWTQAAGGAVNETTPVVGVYTATVTIKDTDAYKTPAPNTITFTIEKATPVLNGTLTQTPTEVAAGSTLADVTLTGTYKNPVNTGMTVAGSIDWKNADATVINGTTKTQDYTFTPDDTDNYNTVQGTHTISLAGLTNPVVSYSDLTHTYDGTKKAATVTWTTPAAGTLTEGTDYKVYYTGTGDTTYTKSDVAPTDAGTYTVSIEIIGNAANTYNNPVATDTLTINPKEIAKTDFDYSGLTVSKREDGTTDPGTVGGSVKFNNGVIIAGDNVTMKVTAGAYADATVGTDKTVTLTFALDGADKGNYVLAADAGTGEFNKAEITKKMSGSIGGGSSSSGSKYYDVTYKVGKGGTISGSDSESVKANAYPTKTPKVTAKDGYEFKGWSLDGKTIVDPSDVRIKEDTTFTAIFDSNKTADLNKEDHIAYVRGYEDGTFAPNKSITRAEAITIFARLMNEKMDVEASYNSSFSDVKAGAWYANYIGYMEDYNIINGYEDGTFRPDAAITRAEFAAMASRFDKLENTDKNAFTDVAASHWAINSINSAYAKGWIGGYPDGTFRPNQNISRAEVVSIVNNMLEREIDAASIAGAQYKTFPDVATNHWAYFDVIEAANEHDYNKDGNKETWK